MAKKRATERPKKPITKSETWKALDAVQNTTVTLEDVDVKIAQTDVLDTAINFVNAWIAHPRDAAYVGKLHEVLVRNTLVLKYKIEIARGRSINAFGASVSDEPEILPHPRRGLLRNRGRGISDVVAKREGVS